MSEKRGFVGTVRSLWSSEGGAIISAELVLVMTIAVLAMLVGLDSISDAVNGELHDVAEAFGAISQTYEWHGEGHLNGSCDGFHAKVSGSSFQDAPDHCDCTGLRCDLGHIMAPDRCEDGF